MWKDNAMTNPINPPAFPSNISNMSMRDYFAIHASHEELMKILLNNKDLGKLGYAELRYMYADKILQERQKEGK